jgi:competence protein ComEC
MVGRLLWRDLGARPLFFPTLFFCLGASCGLFAVALSSVAAGLCLAGAGGLGGICWATAPRAGSHLALLLACAFAGAGLSAWQARPDIPKFVEGAPLRLEGEVESSAEVRGSCRLSVAVARVSPAAPPEARFRATLWGKGEGSCPLPGQRVLVPTSLRREEPAANWGEYRAFSAKLRRAALFKGSFEKERLAVLTSPAGWQSFLVESRQRLAAAVRALSPSPASAGLYLALAAGLRAELPEATERSFSESGLAHILSVSGLHVAALAVLCLWALRRLLSFLLPASFEPRRIAAPLCIPWLWGYVAFTGNQAPAARSAAMATVLFLGFALWRKADALSSLCAACFALVALDPACVADLSLQLSLAAVLSLLLLAPSLRQAAPSFEEKGLPSRAGELVLSSLCASAAVTLASLPLAASAFHRISLAGLFSNILCMPLCGALTLLAALGAAVFLLSPWLATPLLWAGAHASEWLLRASDFFSSLPGASLHLPSFGAAAGATYFVGLGAWGLASGGARKLALLSPLAVAWVAFAKLLGPKPLLAVTFLAVGHGDAIVLESGGQSALVDGGGVPGGRDVGRQVVVPYLRERAIRQLDLAVLSHPHPDHALGLISALEEVPARKLWLPEKVAGGALVSSLLERVGPERTEQVAEGRAPFALGKALIHVLGPKVSEGGGENDRSVVLRVEAGEVSVLLTGDIEKGAEDVLDFSAATLVKAPHHGSRTSSTPHFVERTKPRFVVFCVGVNNRFGFPAPAVVQRYEEVGARCFRTDIHGAVRFETDGRAVRWETFFPDFPRSEASGG